MKRRPLSVTIIACVYILAGAVGLVYHFPEFKAHAWQAGTVGIELVRVLAIVAGIYMLRGANWARWLALAWMAFHVVIGFLHSWGMGAMHAAMLVVIGFFLLRKNANAFFAGNYPTQPKKG